MKNTQGAPAKTRGDAVTWII